MPNFIVLQPFAESWTRFNRSRCSSAQIIAHATSVSRSKCRPILKLQTESRLLRFHCNPQADGKDFNSSRRKHAQGIVEENGKTFPALAIAPLAKVDGIVNTRDKRKVAGEDSRPSVALNVRLAAAYARSTGDSEIGLNISQENSL